MNATQTRLSRQFVKLCDRADFDDSEVEAMIAEMVPAVPPQARVHRKYWEFAMLALYLREMGALNEGAEALAVAAGQEAPVFWMANRVGRVLATDIYGEGAFGQREAAPTMLSEPQRLAPFPYREERLEVRSMNALALELPDASFDIVFCLSSIEHFGGFAGAARGAAEMSRVLRPGGHLIITTECLLRRDPLDLPAVQVAIRALTLGRRCAGATLRRRVTEAFTPGELERHVVAASGLELVQALDLRISPESFENVVSLLPSGELRTATGRELPHIVLAAAHGAPWTSVFLALRKPPQAAGGGSGPEPGPRPTSSQTSAGTARSDSSSTA